MRTVVRIFIVSLLFAVGYGYAEGAEGGSLPEMAHWRLELSGWRGLNVGGHDSSGDTLLTGTVDYSCAVTGRCALGLRLMPLMSYWQETPDYAVFENRTYDASVVWGGGLGMVLRLYAKKDAYRGWFGEAQTNAIFHNNRFSENSSNINFLSGVGVGYQFSNDWHALLKFAHISNARLGEDNAGSNVLGLGIGFSF